MKKYILIIFCVVSSIFYASASEKQIDSIVAIVNDETILNSDVNQILFLLKKEEKDIKIPFKSSFIRDKVIQKLIVESLILQEAKRMHITVTKEQVNNFIKNIALKKNMNIDQFKNNILFHDPNSKISYNDYINNIKKFLIIKTTQDYELHKRINISEQEVNVLFKELIKKNQKNPSINFSYILLPVSKKK